MLLSLHRSGGRVKNRRRPFRFKVGWAKNKELKKLIHETWVENGLSCDLWLGFKRKVHKSQKVIKKWVKKSQSLTEKLISEKTTKLAAIQKEDNPFNMQMEKELKEELCHVRART